MRVGVKWSRAGKKQHTTDTLGQSTLFNKGSDESEMKYPKSIITFSNADKTKNLIEKYKMKINAETPNCINIVLYAAFSSIPLDIEGSNIDFVGWIPSEKDKKNMPSDVYEAEKKKGEEQNAKIIFRNVKTQWDSCDCGGWYPCSHGSYVYAIEVKNENKTHELSLEPEYICFDNDGKYGSLPIPSATIFDFIRMCQLCEIELELSDYAVSLLK